MFVKHLKGQRIWKMLQRISKYQNEVILTLKMSEMY